MVGQRDPVVRVRARVVRVGALGAEPHEGRKLHAEALDGVGPQAVHGDMDHVAHGVAHAQAAGARLEGVRPVEQVGDGERRREGVAAGRGEDRDEDEEGSEHEKRDDGEGAGARAWTARAVAGSR